MRLLFIGDLVGKAGREIVLSRLPGLIDRYGIEFVVVNGENAAAGFGITEKILLEVLDAGADVVTTGNHVWDKAETLVFIDRARAVAAQEAQTAQWHKIAAEIN
ncbi:MAG: YmdB family metallophosphoesterase, partial [Cohaesibacteraceae bacterium]|nr:YmdB family metallophosphoesterase [Cohaesibacteraceae bacterium]